MVAVGVYMVMLFGAEVTVADPYKVTLPTGVESGVGGAVDVARAARALTLYLAAQATRSIP